MSKLKESTNHIGQSGYYSFKCPACGIEHSIDINHRVLHMHWSFNESMNYPTFLPSILVEWDREKVHHRCHSFIKEGKIEFLSDCTHNMKGQTVELPEIDGK